jgi:hypothetical protein
MGPVSFIWMKRDQLITTRQALVSQLPVTGGLVTSLDLEIGALAQLYHDRGDSENPFDELKNQWGWAGFSLCG